MIPNFTGARLALREAPRFTFIELVACFRSKMTVTMVCKPSFAILCQQAFGFETDPANCDTAAKSALPITFGHVRRIAQGVFSQPAKTTFSVAERVFRASEDDGLVLGIGILQLVVMVTVRICRNGVDSSVREFGKTGLFARLREVADSIGCRLVLVRVLQDFDPIYDVFNTAY